MRYLIITALAASTAAAQEPVIFAPGVIAGAANDLSPAFAPNCRDVWYTLANGKESVIVASHFAHGQWGAPTIAPFSGHWGDLEPAMAPDGSHLIFASNRPAADGGAAIDGYWGGAVQPKSGGNLWRVDRRGSGWSTPVRLPDAVNSSTSVFSPSVVGDGSVYFMKADSATGRFQIYRSQFANGQYQPAERTPFSDPQWNNVDPAVAPDESFVVFSSNRPPTADKDLDLFIALRQNGTWQTPVSLGPRVNSTFREIEARLSPDGHTLYFASNRIVAAAPGTLIALDPIRVWNNGLMHIWSVDIAQFIGNPAKGHSCAT